MSKFNSLKYIYCIYSNLFIFFIFIFIFVVLIKSLLGIDDVQININKKNLTIYNN